MGDVPIQIPSFIIVKDGKVKSYTLPKEKMNSAKGLKLILN